MFVFSCFNKNLQDGIVRFFSANIVEMKASHLRAILLLVKTVLLKEVEILTLMLPSPTRPWNKTPQPGKSFDILLVIHSTINNCIINHTPTLIP